MIFTNQKHPLDRLRTLADANRHSIIIDGPAGCGKSYLAKQFAGMVGIEDFVSIPSTVQAVRDAVEECYRSSASVVICIENLDTGSPGASHALLKFLEEPSDSVYVIVTCRSLSKVADTILSRSASVSMNPPSRQDILDYFRSKDEGRFNKISSLYGRLMSSVSSFTEADQLLRTSDSNIEYLNNIQTKLNKSDPVNTIVWSLGHYEDNSETPILFLLRHIANLYAGTRIADHAVGCADDILQSRIASHAAIARFVLDYKYGD